MQEFIVKVLWSNGSARVTIPKVVVGDVGMESARYLILAVDKEGQIVLRRLEHGETFTGEPQGS